MNDDDLDRLLTDAGSEWRHGHERVPDVDVQRIVRRAAWKTTSRWVPLAAAAAVLGVLAIVLVVRPTSHPKDRATENPIAPSTSQPSSAQSSANRRVQLTEANVSVEYVGDGRIVLIDNNFHPGARARLQIRSVDRPEAVSFRLTSAWVKGGDLSCPTLDGDWLVYTDVQDEPSMLAPGPPQAWKLIALNIATGEQRVLDSGIADMSEEFACGVRGADEVAWTSGHTTRTTIYDLRTGGRTQVALSGVPAGFTEDGLVLASYAQGPRATAQLIDPSNGTHRQIATLDGDYVKAVGRYMSWYERTSDDGSSGLVYLCQLPRCPGASPPHNAARVVAEVDGDNPATAIGDTYLAWAAQGGGTVNVQRVNGRPFIFNVDGEVDSLAAAGSLLVFVEKTDAGTSQEKDALHMVQITG